MESRREWTQEETERLRRLYGTMSMADIADKLGRSLGSVRGKVQTSGMKAENKMLVDSHGRNAIYVRGSNPAIFWSAQMIADLKRLYPFTKNGDLMEYFGVSRSTLIHKAREYNLRKDPVITAKWQSENFKICMLHIRALGHPGAPKKGEHRNPKGEFKPGIDNKRAVIAAKAERIRKEKELQNERQHEKTNLQKLD